MYVHVLDWVGGVNLSVIVKCVKKVYCIQCFLSINVLVYVI